jgi:hypothetical protein
MYTEPRLIQRQDYELRPIARPTKESKWHKGLAHEFFIQSGVMQLIIRYSRK